MKLIDTHAHLDEIEEIDGALARAREAGVVAVVAVGSDLASNEKILSLGQRYRGFVFPAVGLHPWRLKGQDLAANLSLIEQELPRCVALGEIGLDFAIDTPRERQEGIFQKLLTIAVREKKPVLLHARRAWAEALEFMKTLKVEKAVFHWYRGPLDILQRILEEGYFISATPAAAGSERHRRAIVRAPLEQILLETDAPEIYQGKPSEPKDLLIALYSVSQLKGMEAEKIAGWTFENAVSFFNLNPG